jgi:hypothetical protein
MPIPQRTLGESRDEFIGRCIETEIAAGKERDQAAAICYLQLKKSSFAEETPMIDPELMKQCMLDLQGMNPSYSGPVAMKICASRLAIGAKQRAQDDSGIIDPETTKP